MVRFTHSGKDWRSLLSSKTQVYIGHTFVQLRLPCKYTGRCQNRIFLETHKGDTCNLKHIINFLVIDVIFDTSRSYYMCYSCVQMSETKRHLLPYYILEDTFPFIRYHNLLYTALNNCISMLQLFFRHFDKNKVSSSGLN